MNNYTCNRSFCLVNAVQQSLVMLLSLAAVMPAYAAVASATVSADITTKIAVRTINGLYFGEISSGSEAGTLTLSTGGVRTTTGGVSVNRAVAGSPASFDLQGAPNASYTVSFPAAVILTNGSPNSMVVDGFNSSPDNTGVIDASGQQTLYVGGTLNVDSNQSFGSYTGLLNITVDYN